MNSAGLQLLEKSARNSLSLSGEGEILLDILKQAEPDDYTIENESLDDYFMDLYEQEESR